MPQYFKTKISYTQTIGEDSVGIGDTLAKTETKTESYLVDAVSFTDAEARTIEQAGSLPDLHIAAIARQKVWDLIRHETGEQWFKAKVLVITENERTGKLKKNPVFIFVNADDHKQAGERIEESMKKGLDPFEVKDVVSTDIVEVLEYVAPCKE